MWSILWCLNTSGMYDFFSWSITSEACILNSQKSRLIPFVTGYNNCRFQFEMISIFLRLILTMMNFAGDSVNWSTFAIIILQYVSYICQHCVLQKSGISLMFFLYLCNSCFRSLFDHCLFFICIATGHIKSICSCVIHLIKWYKPCLTVNELMCE